MAVAEEDRQWLAEAGWQQLMQLESQHRQIQQNHERLIRTLDEAAQSQDRSDLLAAWQQYRSVVADLSRVTEEIGTIRLIQT